MGERRKMGGLVWLCVEDGGHDEVYGYVRVWGDTGPGRFDQPYRAEECEFGGRDGHGDLCGWFVLAALEVDHAAFAGEDADAD